jgi:hypothetical protein
MTVAGVAAVVTIMVGLHVAEGSSTGVAWFDGIKPNADLRPLWLG